MIIWYQLFSVCQLGQKWMQMKMKILIYCDDDDDALKLNAAINQLGEKKKNSGKKEDTLKMVWWRNSNNKPDRDKGGFIRA